MEEGSHAQSVRQPSIIPCIIDDTPLDGHPVLQGRLFAEARETAAGSLCWIRLKYFLTEYFLAKNETRYLNGPEDVKPRSERVASLQRLKSNQSRMRGMFPLLLDAAARIDLVAPDRDRVNPYNRRMVEALEAAAAKVGPDASPALRELMSFIPELLARLPGDDPGIQGFRDELVRLRLRALDPEGSDPWLSASRPVIP
jgi:hypothetical protein